MNVADRVERPRSRSREFTTWTAAEVRAFLDARREDRLYALWTTLATTGLRRGEALGLRWRDVDLDAGRASIVQQVTSVDCRIVVGEVKTRAGRRAVALDPETVAILKRWKARQGEERLAWGPDYQDSGLVFTREDGQVLHPDLIRRMFDRHVKAAGLPKVRLHDLRHGWATLALAAGVHPKVVQERLGHANISITLNTYSHVAAGMQEEAAARVAGLVFGS